MDADLGYENVFYRHAASAREAMARVGEKWSHGKMIRKAFVMSVYPDRHEEYERRHNPIWPELRDALASHGVHNYSIFLDSEDNRLFAYAEVEDEDQWKRIAETAVCKRWWEFMKEIMPSNADNSPKSKDLREVFHIT